MVCPTWNYFSLCIAHVLVSTDIISFTHIVRRHNNTKQKYCIFKKKKIIIKIKWTKKICLNFFSSSGWMILCTIDDGLMVCTAAMNDLPVAYKHTYIHTQYLPRYIKHINELWLFSKLLLYLLCCCTLCSVWTVYFGSSSWMKFCISYFVVEI